MFPIVNTMLLGENVHLVSQVLVYVTQPENMYASKYTCMHVLHARMHKHTRTHAHRVEKIIIFFIRFFFLIWYIDIYMSHLSQHTELVTSSTSSKWILTQCF